MDSAWPLLLLALLTTGCSKDEGATSPAPSPAKVAAPRPASSDSFGVDAETGESFGPAAPDFALPTLEGETFRLSEQRGKVVVLNFWATWCGPCLEEMPGFIALQEELGEQGVRFVGVSLDEEGAAVVRPFAREIGVNYPLVVDDYTVADLYGMTDALPTTFLINRKGQVVAHLPGMLREEALRPVLEELISESAPPAEG